MGVDPRQSDQMVRGVVSLPNGSGRGAKVAVFAKAAGRYSNPDSIEVDGSNIYVGYQNVTAKDGSEQVYNYNYDAILAGGSGGTTRLQDGDVIIIPQRRLFE